VPELPEVEVVRHGLAPAISGATIEAVEVFDERSLRRHAGPAEDFIDRLTGARIDSAVRRGKFLWLPIVDAHRAPHEAVVVHLGMSGQVLLRERGVDDGSLTRIRLEISHPEHGALRVNFVDQRIFGSMALDELAPTVDGAAGGFGSRLASIPTQVAHIARDPLDDAFDDRAFLRRLAARRTTVKRALLDQTLISGIGNIYAD